MSKRTSLTKNDGQVVRSEKPTSVELTIYKSGDAVVHESRSVELPEGKVTIQLEGLPANFVEDSFEISDAAGPGDFKLGPDSFQPANLSSQALLAKAVGHKITLLEQTAQGLIRTTGTLRFVLGNQLVIEDANGIQVLPTPPKFELESIPDGLSATPALSLEPTASKSGVYLLNSMYETGGLSWAPRYAVFYDDKTGLITKLRCRVKLTNNTGADFDDAVMKLLDAHNTSRGGGRGHRGAARMASLEAAPMAASFGGGADYADSAEVGSVGEQKIYMLPDKLSIKNGETKRPYLVVARNVPVKAELYVPAAYGYQLRATKEDDQKLPVFVRLRLRNDADNNLGSALPGGEVSVFQPDSTGKYQKTDPQLHIGAVAQGEAFKLELTTPSSDVKASRRLVSFHQDPEEKEPEAPVTPEGGLEDGSEVEVMEGGAHPMPSFGMRPAVQGGPGVGTPGEHSRRRQEVAEGAGKKAKKEPKPRFREEQREITIYNFKDRDVQVQVQETLPHGFTWLDKTHDLIEDSENSGVFTVDVPAGQSTTVTYGIRWKIN